METQLINDLISILQQETKVYEDILKISRNKTNVIVEGKIAELENIVKLEQSLVLQISKLESGREGLVARISKTLNIKPSDITISEVIKHIDGQLAQQLKSSQERMVSTVKELASTNDLNSKLIRNSLEYINFSINLVSSINAGTNNYGNTGHVSDPKKKTFFDVKL